VGTLPPDDLPRSPTGRVPKWVMDQAAGRPVDEVPFRPPTGPSPLGTDPQSPRTARRRATNALVGVLVVAIIGGGMYWSISRGAGVVPPGVTADRTAGADTTTGAVPHDRPPAGHEETRRPKGLPVGGAHESPTSNFHFTGHQKDRTTPVTWSPCRPIHYVVRPDHAPHGGATLLHSAIGEVARLTGLTFVDDGATKEAPIEDRQPYQPDLYGDRWAPVLITWDAKNEVADFGTDIIGEAAAQEVSTPAGDYAYVTGDVRLDVTWFTREVTTAHGRDMARATILHELGHLVGLAHDGDKAQLMFPRAQDAVVDFGSGDRAGLQALGRGPCQPGI